MPAATAPKQLDLFGEKLLDPSSRLKHKLIGQLFDTYWLIEYNDHLYIIDSKLPAAKRFDLKADVGKVFHTFI